VLLIRTRTAILSVGIVSGSVLSISNCSCPPTTVNTASAGRLILLRIILLFKAWGEHYYAQVSCSHLRAPRLKVN
jgi:hypothetical protein